MTRRHPIIEQSFQLIDREVGAHALSPEEYQIARRVIHATADFDFIRLIEFRGDFVAAARRALRDRCPVIVDSHMTLEGVRSALSALEIAPRCFLGEPAVRMSDGQTRTGAAMRHALSCLSGALVVVGNSPTALLAICEELRAGRAHVRAVIGMPVGFVSVEESKAALGRLPVPSLLSRGRKGGSAAAAAAVNALAELTGERSGCGHNVPAPDGVTTPAMDNGIVHVVGVGASGLEDLAPRLRRLIAGAEVLAGGERHLAMVGESDADKIVLRGDLAAAVRRLDERRKGRRAVVLASGDPLFYGIGRLLLEHIRREDLVFHPAPSSVQLAFARLKIPWHDAAVVSLHGRPIDRLDAALEAGRTPIAVLTGPRNTPAEIGRVLLRYGEYTIHVCENLGGDDERVTSLSPDEAVRHGLVSPLNVVVLTRTGAPRPPEGIPDEAFTTRPGRRGMITKVEVRVLTLSRLALRAGHVMYDVGAGSGSVSIEAGRLAPGARIFAVERRAEDAAVLRENLERLAVSNVSVIEGDAPEALRDLPEADRVFVGGSGGRLRPILDAAHGKLRAGGIIVLNAITLESTWESVDRLRALACDVDVLDVHVSRSALLGGRLIRRPLDPVTIVRGIKR